MAEEKIEEFSITLSELREGGITITFTIPRLLEWMAAMAEAEKKVQARSPVENEKNQKKEN